MAAVPERVPKPGRLASDAERERATRSLRRHFAAGRLTPEQLEERAAKAVSARTRPELAELFSDLPSGRRRRMWLANRAALRAHAGAYAAGNGALVGIWALTGAGEFWPAYALLPTTGLLASHGGLTYYLRRVARLRHR